MKKYSELSDDEQIDVMKNDTTTYWHNGKISYMGMSRIIRGRDTECDGLGKKIWRIAQETGYRCELCGKEFVTEGE